MTDTSRRKDRPTLTDRTKADQEARAARLAEEMRANLRKRKAQQRNRDQPPAPKPASNDER